MVNYQLVYFNGRGRAEVARLLFAQAGVEYEDKRIPKEEWPALKPDTPTGVVPYLVIDGYKLPQSNAIARYLAREFSMYGETSLEAGRIDALCDSLSEFVDAAVKVNWAPDDTAREAAKKALQPKAVHTFKLVDKSLEESGTGWVVGNRVSLADFVAYHTITNFRGNPAFADVYNELDQHEKIIAHHEKIANLPNIKQWLDTRPKTDF